MTYVSQRSETFADALAEARSRAGLSLKQTADRLNELAGSNVDPQAVHNWEKGRKVPPSARMIEHIAAVLDGDAVEWCVLAGKTPVAVSEALRDVAFAERVYQLALEHRRHSR